MSRLIVDILEGKYPVQQHRALCESATSALQLIRGTDNFSTSVDGFRLPYISEPCKPHSFVRFGLTHYILAVQFGKPVSIQVAFQESTARPALSVSKVTPGNNAHEQLAAMTGAIPLEESPADEQCRNLFVDVEIIDGRLTLRSYGTGDRQATRDYRRGWPYSSFCLLVSTSAPATFRVTIHSAWEQGLRQIYSTMWFKSHPVCPHCRPRKECHRCRQNRKDGVDYFGNRLQAPQPPPPPPGVDSYAQHSWGPLLPPSSAPTLNFFKDISPNKYASLLRMAEGKPPSQEEMSHFWFIPPPPPPPEEDSGATTSTSTTSRD